MSNKTTTDKGIFGKTSNLAGMLNYQEGSIVSRTLLKKDTGTITMFAFAKGQELSPHSAPFDAFVQIIDGENTVMIGDEKHELSAGDSIIMPADIPHAVIARENFKMLLVMIK